MALAVEDLADPLFPLRRITEAVEAGGGLLDLPEMIQPETQQAADEHLADHPMGEETHGAVGMFF